MSPSRGPRPDDVSPSTFELLGLGVGIAVAVVVPLVLGLLADARFHFSPLGLLTGLLLGIVAACTTVYQRFKHYW